MDRLIRVQSNTSRQIKALEQKFNEDSEDTKTHKYASTLINTLRSEWTNFVRNHSSILELSEKYPDTPYLSDNTHGQTRRTCEDLNEKLEKILALPDIDISTTPIEKTDIKVPISTISNPTLNSNVVHQQVNFPHFNTIKMSSSKFLDLIPEYDPRENASHFTRKAQLIFNLLTEETDKSLFATMICLKLKGPVLDKLTVNQQESWEDIKKVLLKSSAPSISLEVLQAKLARTTQLANETAASFGNRVTQLHTDLVAAHRQELTLEEGEIPPSTLRILERQVTRTFEDGLRDPELRAIALVKESPTLSAAVSFISDREARVSSRNGRHTYTPNIQNSPRCFRCGLSGHLSTQCTSNPSQTFRTTKQEPISGSTCNYCKETGHVIADCTLRRENNQRKYGSPDQPRNPSQSPPQKTLYRNPFSKPSNQAKPSTSQPPLAPKNHYSKPTVNWVHEHPLQTEADHDTNHNPETPFRVTSESHNSPETQQ